MNKKVIIILTIIGLSIIVVVASLLDKTPNGLGFYVSGGKVFGIYD